MLKAASEAGPMEGILGYTTDMVVSTDFLGDTRYTGTPGRLVLPCEAGLMRDFGCFPCNNRFSYSFNQTSLRLTFFILFTFFIC